MIDTEVDWFYEPFHLPKIQEKGRINAKIYVLQNHRYRFVYWGLLGVFLALKVLCMHEIHEFFNKITIIRS